MKDVFNSIDDEIKYLKEQLAYWNAYHPHNSISAMARMARITKIKNRLRVLTKNL
jgi:hypothetical protein